ncbi:hypothetical protein WDU94_008335 [Cyamophila willieti]
MSLSPHFLTFGRCNREKPPCKYFHPPQHLKDQLLINGRNHLALKNALLQQMGLTPPGQPMLPGQMPTVSKMSSFSPSTTQAQLSVFTSQQSQLNLMATTPYLAAGMTQVGNTFSPYFSPAGPLMPTMMTQDPNNSLALVQQNAVAQQKIARTDRIEVCREFQRGGCKRTECRFAHPGDKVVPGPDNMVTVCMDALKGRCAREPCRYYHPPLHLQAHLKAAHSVR